MGEEESKAGLAVPDHEHESEEELRARLDLALEDFSHLQKQIALHRGDTALSEAVEAKRAELIELTKRLPYHPEREDPAFVHETEFEVDQAAKEAEERAQLRREEGADEVVIEAERKSLERERRGEPPPAAHERDVEILEPLHRYAQFLEEEKRRKEREKEQPGETSAPDVPMSSEDPRAQGLPHAFGSQPSPSSKQAREIPIRESKVEEETRELHEKILDTLNSMDSLYDGIVDASEAFLDPRERREICESAHLFVEGSWGLASSTIGISAKELKDPENWPARPKKLLQQLRADLEARWDQLSETAARLNRESGFDEPEDS